MDNWIEDWLPKQDVAMYTNNEQLLVYMKWLPLRSLYVVRVIRRRQSNYNESHTICFEPNPEKATAVYIGYLARHFL